jgi:hypothetical protein
MAAAASNTSTYVVATCHRRRYRFVLFRSIESDDDIVNLQHAIDEISLR